MGGIDQEHEVVVSCLSRGEVARAAASIHNLKQKICNEKGSHMSCFNSRVMSIVNK